MPPTAHIVAPRIRRVVKEICKLLTGIELNREGRMFRAEAERQMEGDDCSADDKELYIWARAIFIGLEAEPAARSLRMLDRLIQGVKAGVSERLGHDSSDKVIEWVLSNYPLSRLQDESGIPVLDAVQAARIEAPWASSSHAPAPHVPATAHHGVSLPPPRVVGTQSVPYLPPVVTAITSRRGGDHLPRIDELNWAASQRSSGQHSLAKGDHRLVSTFTARKAAIYGTTPEEWAERAAHRL